MPEVDAPDGSGCLGLLGAGVFCLGLVPNVEGVGILEVVYVLGLVSEGVAGASGGCGGATGGATFAAGAVVVVVVGSKGWSFGTDIQLY